LASSTLYIVSTPIGNLEDITLRAIRVLKEVDLIAAEDTRHTSILLDRYDIRTPTTSFHEHNEHQKTPALLTRLGGGERIALVSDAGTPGISDPGYRLVKAAREAGYHVQAVPGPSAVLAALVSSGFPTDSFTFLGFPPRKGEARRTWIRDLAAEPRTVVFFEAPHRLRRTLEDLVLVLGERPICLARELTKIHEQLVIQPICGAISGINPILGEYTVVVSPINRAKHVPAAAPTEQQLTEFIGQQTECDGGTKRAGIARAARHFGLSSRQVYAALERAKKSQNTQ
jgi:16S rRNA (cytidine1402-2'-O)-methyltransferase